MAQTVLAKMAVEISANTAKFNEGLTRASQQTKKFQDGIKQLGLSLVAGFGLMEVGRQIIDVTSQFQKFEAVLTNTLGSNSDAQYALQAIRDFAIKTPFEVKELTAAYVRWANQGLNPTIDKMRMLGDVASSLGAGFEQTAEAFKDLAVGQTKRIEEIGISAQQANGKIQLSFKGVNIEIEKNAQGVQKALETYSQLTGVIGSTEAVAKTLGGQVSNLKDAWDNFLLTIGQSTGGILSYAVTGLTNLLTVFSNLSSEIGILSTKLAFWKDVNDLSKETLDYAIKLGKTNAGNSIADVIKQLEGNKTAVEQYASVLTGSMEVQKAFRKEFEKQGESADVVNRLWYAYFRDLKKRAEMEQKQSDAAKKAAEQIKKDAEAAIRLAARQDAEEKARAQNKAQLQIEEIKRNAEKLGLLTLLNNKIDEISSKELLSKNELSVVKKAADEVEKLVQKFNELSDVGVKTNIPALGTIDRTTVDTTFLKDYENYINKIREANNRAIESFQANKKAFNEAFGTAAQQGLADFFNGLSDVANGQISFGDNFLQALAEFMKTFGRNLVALGIAKLGLDNLFKAGPAGAAIAIAAGVALQTAAGAVQKSLAKRSQNISGGSSGGSFGNQTINASSMQNNINVTGQLVGSGRDLVAVINNTSFDNKVRKGG